MVTHLLGSWKIRRSESKKVSKITPSTDLVTRPENETIILAGQAANHIAAHHVFDDYRARKSTNTLRRQHADLALFARYLGVVAMWDRSLDTNAPESEALRNVKAVWLQTDPESWRGVTWGLVAGFVQWQLTRGYALQSINVRLSTVKKYTALAFKAGIIDATEHALIRTVAGYTHKETKHVDEKRTDEGVPTRYPRKGAKKAESVRIPDDLTTYLKNNQPATPQGRRDALLMCLLLDHGLRCGEIALLTVGNFNVSEGTFTFYRPKVDKIQIHNLTPDTRRALRVWIESGDCAQDANALLFRGSRKDGSLTDSRMSERAITERVRVLGEYVGINSLSAHDCRHYWATRASRKGTDPFSLQEAGGWNSLAMPRRYVEAARIANQGVKLE